MASDAATATIHTIITTTPIIALILVTLCYAWLCWLRPFKCCRRCAGQGHTTTRFLRRRRTCRRCAGEGWRLRTGRRAYNHLRHAAATSTTRRRAQASTVGHTPNRAPGGGK